VIEIKPTPRPDIVPAEDVPSRGADGRLELLNQILESRTFAKSSRLAHFLKFICLQTIEGKAREINEQQIGIHVFARSPMYSASDDSIVRTQARLLRQRLEEYFEHECPACPIVITIPKGGYVPVFEPRQHGPIPAIPVSVAPSQESTSFVLPATADAPEKPSALPETRSHQLRFGVIAGLVLLLLVGAIAYIWLGGRHNVMASDALWSRIFEENRSVVIVPSDDALVLFEEETKAPVALADYLSGSYLDKSNPPKLGAASFTSDWFAAHQYTSTADLNLALRLGRLPAAAQAVVETRNARILHIDDLKSRNVILIGGIGANPWIGLFAKHLNFEVNYDWKTSEGYVLNKRPAKGEASIYRETVADGAQHSYGVLAFLPGIEGEGEALLFEGTGMAGTESASDFPFNAAAFQGFARRIGATSGRMPYFEVLLETTSIAGNAPEAHVLTYHLIEP